MYPQQQQQQNPMEMGQMMQMMMNRLSEMEWRVRQLEGVLQAGYPVSGASGTGYRELAKPAPMAMDMQISPAYYGRVDVPNQNQNENQYVSQFQGQPQYRNQYQDYNQGQSRSQGQNQNQNQYQDVNQQFQGGQAQVGVNQGMYNRGQGQNGGASVQGQEQIIAVRKNEDGDILAIQTDQGRVLQYDQALAEAKSGHLAHVDVFHKYGRDILRSEPDGIKENNLDNLPQF
jgi:hypothetical protein